MALSLAKHETDQASTVTAGPMNHENVTVLNTDAAKNQSYKLHEAGKGRTKRRNRKIYDYIWLFSYPSLKNRPRREKIKAIKALSNTTNQPDIIDLDRTLWPTTAQYTLSSPL